MSIFNVLTPDEAARESGIKLLQASTDPLASACAAAVAAPHRWDGRPKTM
jgi:hypothetical protein